MEHGIVPRRYARRPTDSYHVRVTTGSKAAPRPNACALELCGKRIGPEDPLYYDNVMPMMVEHLREDGKTVFLEKIGCFCSPDCRLIHRGSQRRPVPLSPRPSP